MNGRSDNGLAQTSPPTASRKGALRRVLTLGALAVVALTILAACGPDVDKPYSTTSPASPTAEDIHSLYKLVFWLSLIVFATQLLSTLFNVSGAVIAYGWTEP